jgi:hypothetical protein
MAGDDHADTVFRVSITASKVIASIALVGGVAQG